MTDEKGYNGWTNYETWAVNLWVDNDEGLQDYWRQNAREIYREAAPRWDFEDKRDAALREFEDWAKNEVEEMAPDLGASMFADLLGAAISSVDWRDIARHWIDDAATDVDNEDPQDEDDEDAETCAGCDPTLVDHDLEWCPRCRPSGGA